jgi:hypothetical protein
MSLGNVLYATKALGVATLFVGVGATTVVFGVKHIFGLHTVRRGTSPLFLELNNRNVQISDFGNRVKYHIQSVVPSPNTSTLDDAEETDYFFKKDSSFASGVIEESSTSREPRA